MLYDMINGALDRAQYSSLRSIADETDWAESRVAIEAFGGCPDFKMDGTRMKAVPAQEVLNMLNRHAEIAVGMESTIGPQKSDKHHLRNIFEQINRKHASLGGNLGSSGFSTRVDPTLKEDIAALESDLAAMESEMDSLNAMLSGEETDIFGDRETAVDALESFISFRQQQRQQRH